jgi:choline dehydrogenase
MDANPNRALPPGPQYDYIVVGSGAGGGPVACNLAKARHSVLLLEAGDDSEGLTYQVPVFHGQATEDPTLRWDYFVQHYEDPQRQRADSKYAEARGGVLYPRAGTLGGCTAHNAMITLYPHNSDWDTLAEITGDSSWRAAPMRRYFERLERCEYLLAPGEYPANFWRRLALRVLRGFGMASRANPTRHGFSGWLWTNMADPLLVLGDDELEGIVLAAAKAAGFATIFGPQGLLRKARLLVQALWKRQSVLDRTRELVDPNDWRNVLRSQEGLALIPIATRLGQRNGTREYIREVAAAGYPLTVALRALAARVLLDDSQTAIGVEYLEGQSLYRADPRAQAAGQPAPGTPRVAYARREVILAGGAFNTPQLLMLSGIGPPDELRRHGIPVRVALPGVGRNLQDRYEVGVISELKHDFAALRDATFDPVAGDPLLTQWKEKKTGLYTSNGAICGIALRSKPERPQPDLFVFGLPGYFKGYFPGYSRYFLHEGDPTTPAAAHGEALLALNKSRFTWAILKAHTNNTAGFVRLRSADPRDTPEINFKYFDEGNDATGDDLESVVEGVKFVRRMSKSIALFTKSELLPGKDLDQDDELRTFIKDEAWGHHACGTCKIGPEGDPMAVLDSRFRVRGTHRLRVVDASVFPRIPGFFIVTPIYMIAEKASDVILDDARTSVADHAIVTSGAAGTDAGQRAAGGST